MTDVTALGELLIDFTENGISEQGNPILEANPGGAPCNVLAMLTKLGNQTLFIGKVGNDSLGKMLKDKVTALGIDTTYLYQDEIVHTTLAFVHTAEDGDREFSFYRNPGADMMLRAEEVNEEAIKESKIFHFDPNLREPLWDSLDEARKQVSYGMSMCDILKISDNEIEWYTGESDYTKAVEKILENYQIPLILVSMGKQGSRAYYKNQMVEVPAILQKNTIETTGAGDTFDACVLDYILKHGLENLSEQNLKEMLTFANAAASIVTTRKGALCVMPSKEDVEEILKK